MVFEFTPEEVGIFEAFFLFKVPSKGIEELFLFSGRVEEPLIEFDVSKVDFGSTILKGDAPTESLTLINHENTALLFPVNCSHWIQALDSFAFPISGGCTRWPRRA